MIKKLTFATVLIILMTILVSCNGKYNYETVANDPLKTRIYTLDNGLKVYLSVNKDLPRVQTYIAVRAGGKNDPAETTGLAHYLEHLLFKGTPEYGTTDYVSEKPYLDQIENLYEAYRRTTDKAERTALYGQIDSISQKAAKFAIPNEYDKMMSAIGTQGSNAFTSFDVTAYIENIPSNEIENWAIIQSGRFKDPVIRLFHTELETVYEEYNRSLTNDNEKVYDAILASLYPHHPYGKQTVIGKQEHLKNPSITNIKNYFNTYYVPNNMAVCMAGDFNPDDVIVIINKYFGDMKSQVLPELKTEVEAPILKPIVKQIYGIESESVTIAFRLPAANSEDAPALEFMDYMLTNGKAGLIDLNLNQKQRVINAGSSTEFFAEGGLFELHGTPKEGQTLEEVKDLLLSQLELIRKGEFDETLLESVINNFKFAQYSQLQSANYTAYALLNAFINGVDWKDQVNKIVKQSKITKKDLVDLANKYCSSDNYVVVYKRKGESSAQKIDKPKITPIPTNRDFESKFFTDLKLREVMPIEPVFVDFDKDLTKLTTKQDLPVLYKKNETNPLFSLSYVFEMGNSTDKALGTAFEYLNYLGTSQKTAKEIQRELYQMACSFKFNVTDDRVYINISGLSDNFNQATQLLESHLNDIKVDKEAYNNLSDDILKSRSDEKLNQSANFSRLVNFAIWGSKSPAINILSANELRTMDPQDLIEHIHSLKNYKHTILYYGPLSSQEVLTKLNEDHVVADKLKDIPAKTNMVEQTTNEPLVLVANYDAKQVLMSMLNKGGKYDTSIEPIRQLYNEYFGGGMNGIVFQEMREARALAYTASAAYLSPTKPEYSYFLRTYIGTQTDKMNDAILAFDQILNDLPQSEKAFDIAKENLMTNLRTQRILRENVLWTYLNAQKWGFTTDNRKYIFDSMPALTLSEVSKFQEHYVKNKPLTYCVLGNIKDIDMSSLKKLGKVSILKQEEIFGY